MTSTGFSQDCKHVRLIRRLWLDRLDFEQRSLSPTVPFGFSMEVVEGSARASTEAFTLHEPSADIDQEVVFIARRSVFQRLASGLS